MEKEISGGDHEQHCNFMMLVRNESKIELLCLKSNPWEKYQQPDPIKDSSDQVFSKNFDLFKYS